MARTNLRPARPSLGSTNNRATFNLFRRKREADLLCAVPEDCPVPGFLNAGTWEFLGTVREPTTVLSPFNRRAAEASVRFNGFYLFEASLTAPDWITIASSRQQPRAAGAPSLMPDHPALSGSLERGARQPEMLAF